MKFEKALKLLRRGKKVRPCECRCWMKLEKTKQGETIVNANGKSIDSYITSLDQLLLSDKWEVVK